MGDEKMKLRCNDCGAVFGHDEVIEQKEGLGVVFGDYASLNTYHCPECGGEDYDEVDKCKVCGSYDHDADMEVCGECVKDIVGRLNYFLNNEFTELEREVLREYAEI
jgi:RecJ-like exonuclease